MAISILSSPPNFVAAHNQVPYTIQSTNTGQPNFNFVIDVRQVGTSDITSRLVFPVVPGFAFITIDVGPVLKNLVSYDFINGVGNIQVPNTNSRAKWYCEFRELYDIAGVPTLSAVLASDPTTPSSSSFKVAANAIEDFEDFTVGNFSSREIASGITLNVFDDIDYSIQPNNYLPFYYLDKARLINAYTINQYDSDGVFLDQDTGTGSPAANEFIFTLIPLNTPGFVLQDDTAYLEVLFRHDSDLYAVKRIYIDRDCSKYETFRLHWLNKWGGFESYNFRKLSRHAETIERKQFKSLQNINYNKYDRLKTNYNTYIDDTILINSDIIIPQGADDSTDAIVAWFEILATSPIIYLEKDSSTFISYNILTATYEFKKYVNDKKVFNISVEIAPSYTRYRQSL